MEKKSSTSFKSLTSIKSHGSSEKEVKIASDKSPTKSSKRSIRLVKRKSMRLETEGSNCESGSEGNIWKAATKNSFYKVLDRIRGLSRRSSVMSAGESSRSGGQSEFLASISGMSDSRIVENWLLSIDTDTDQVTPDMAPDTSEPPPLETLSLLTVPQNRVDQTTPTNVEFDGERKAIEDAENPKTTYYLSSEDSSVADVFEEKEQYDRRQSMFKPVGFGRQVSESSEYTTDTHDTDTGEIAHVTALNTIRNTSDIFTSYGDEIKKVNLSPASCVASAVFRPIPASCVSISAESCQSSVTMRTVSSSVSRPGAIPRVASTTSDVQGSGCSVTRGGVRVLPVDSVDVVSGHVSRATCTLD